MFWRLGEIDYCFEPRFDGNLGIRILHDDSMIGGDEETIKVR